jgi:hypothetical protein
MNATTASFLGLRRRQRAQDLLREAPKKGTQEGTQEGTRKSVRVRKPKTRN